MRKANNNNEKQEAVHKHCGCDVPHHLENMNPPPTPESTEHTPANLQCQTTKVRLPHNTSHNEDETMLRSPHKAALLFTSLPWKKARSSIGADDVS